MCRAVKVLCVASDTESLQALKMAAVGASWELAPGATTEDDAVSQLGEGRAHIMVVFGDWSALVRRARETYPGVRVIADFEAAEVDVTVRGLDDVRPSILGAPTPAGPVRGVAAEAE